MKSLWLEGGNFDVSPQVGRYSLRLSLAERRIEDVDTKFNSVGVWTVVVNQHALFVSGR